MFRASVFAGFAAILAVAGCGPTVDQSPAKQAVANQVHAQIMQRYRTFRSESGIKVMAACIDWNANGRVKVSGLNWYYYPTSNAYYTRPISELEQSALGECQKVGATSESCECQTVSINDRNALAVPDDAVQGDVIVSFVSDG